MLMTMRRLPLRANPARFNIGDLVRVRSVIFSRFIARVGTVVRVHTSRAGNHTLDKYTVGFSDGSEAEFWDVQLERAANADRDIGGIHLPLTT